MNLSFKINFLIVFIGIFLFNSICNAQNCTIDNGYRGFVSIENQGKLFDRYLTNYNEGFVSIYYAQLGVNSFAYQLVLDSLGNGFAYRITRDSVYLIQRFEKYRDKLQNLFLLPDSLGYFVSTCNNRNLHMPVSLFNVKVGSSFFELISMDNTIKPVLEENKLNVLYGIFNSFCTTIKCYCN